MAAVGLLSTAWMAVRSGFSSSGPLGVRGMWLEMNINTDCYSSGFGVYVKALRGVLFWGLFRGWFGGNLGMTSGKNF